MTNQECNEALEPFLVAPRSWAYVRDHRRNQYLETLTKIAEKTLSSQVFGFIHFIKSGIYYDNGDFNNGYEEARKCLSYGEECGDWWMIAMALNNIGVFYGQQENVITAFDYYWQAINCIQETGEQDAPLLYLLYGNVGECMVGVQEYAKALEYFAMITKFHIPEDFVHIPMNNAFTNMCKIECYYGLHQYDNAFHVILDHEILEATHEETKVLHYTFLVWKYILLYEMGENDSLPSICKELLKFDIQSICILSLKTLCTFLYEKKEFDFFKEALFHLEEDAKKEQNFSLELSSVDLWLRYYLEIGDIDKFQKKCTKFYHLQQQKEKRELSIRTDSLNTIVSVAERAQQQQNDQRMQELLRQKSEYDELTGIPNRYRLREFCASIFPEAAAKGESISIEILDIDCFKQLNDYYGHLEGDACLKALGNEILNSLGGEDLGARYGGDEFIIVRRNCSNDEINHHMRNLKENFMALAIPNINSTVSDIATISQGAYNGIPNMDDNLGSFLKLADDALFCTKKKFKNSYLLKKET